MNSSPLNFSPLNFPSRLNFLRLRVIAAFSVITLIVAGATAAPTLRDAAADKLILGVAVSPSDVADEPLSRLITAQFSSITAANDFKPDHLEPTPGAFTFDNADRIAHFAREHDLALIGHTLCWHQQTPKWMFQDPDGQPLPRAQALANLRSHVIGVAGHYRGQVRGWDVVNEAASDAEQGSDLRDTPALRAIGEDYLEQAFRFAAEADPGAELYYSDFNIEVPGKRERAVRIIRRLKSAGVRIDAVGIQGHWGMKYPGITVIEDAIRAFKAEGVNVMVTELDIDVFPYRKSGERPKDEEGDPYHDACPPEVLAAQARRYRELFELFLKHRDTVTRVTFWGVHDGTSWLNDFPVHGRTNYPLLWDRHLGPKPAFDAVMDALNGR